MIEDHRDGVTDQPGGCRVPGRGVADTRSRSTCVTPREPRSAAASTARVQQFLLGNGQPVVRYRADLQKHGRVELGAPTAAAVLAARRSRRLPPIAVSANSVVAISGWHLHRHHRGPQFLIHTTNAGWGVLSGPPGGLLWPRTPA